MKKNTNLTSRRKWVLTGVMGFAGVALLTTGFATFIVGNMNNTAAEDIGVTVDTVQNNSVELSVNLTDNEIALKETTSKGTSTDIVQSDVLDATALDITGNITVKYGDSFFNKETQTMSLKFSLKYVTGSEPTAHPNNQKNLIQETGNKIGTKRTQAKTASSTGDKELLDSWTYIEAPEAIDLTEVSPKEEGNLNVITLNAQKLSFKWGSFFNGMSPVSYYNDLEFDNKTAASDQITSELNAMRTAMNDNTLELTAKIVVEDIA